MSVARSWFDGLDPEVRTWVLRVIAIDGVPTDEQIAEAPDLISNSWSFDAMGIPTEQREVLRKVIDQLAAELRASKPRPRRPLKK